MFRKDYKVKSNNQLKRTELKTLKDAVLKAYPTLTEQDLNDIFPKKDRINVVKILTSANQTVQIYTVQAKPLLFEVESALLPTVFLLWQYPNLLLSFTTHAPVFAHIANGADLMMPGVVVPPNGYGAFQTQHPAYMNFTTNKAAVAVGRLAQSSSELMSGDRRGKCLTILHVYGDKLCCLDHYKPPPIPELGAPDFLTPKTFEEEFPALGQTSSSENSPQTSSTVENASSSSKSETEQMDELLVDCMLTVLKYSKNLTLPVLTSNFYKQMMGVCPDGKSLDIKKSSFKKVGNFIQEMSKIGLITTKEEKKGVEVISEYNQEHALLSEFYLDKSDRPVAASLTAEEKTSGKKILEGYIITPSAANLFRQFGLQKGETIQAADVRKYVTDYVKKNNLQDPQNKGIVHLKNELAELCKTTGTLTWEQLMEKILKSMKPCYTVSGDGQQEAVIKGKVEPITMVISNRSGNKKVTLVDNLELYGISIHEFAKQCQHGVAASTTISQVAGKKSQQLLVQGNQIHFIYKLLKDEYKIPQRYIRGLEFANKKNKS